MNMAGQAISFEEKQKMVQTFVETVNPYEKKPGLKFDLRRYSEYLSDHNISGNNVPPSVLKMFSKQ
jgi:hypothetical protein